jgi:hypothetical protein
MADKATTKATDLPTSAAGTVVMNFPRVVMLQRKDRSVVRFEMGIQDVPAEIVNEPAYKEWLELNGAKVYIPKVQALNPSQIEVTQHHVDFLRSRGYINIKSVADAKAFIERMTVRDAQGFFEGAAKWTGQAPNPDWSKADDPSKPPAPAEQPASQPGQPATAAPAEQPAPANDPPDKAISAAADPDQGANAADSQSGSEAASAAAAASPADSAAPSSAAAAPAAAAADAGSGKSADKGNEKSKGKGK